MHTTLNGINLGGWLVLEPWMTPSLFKGTTARNEFELSSTSEGKARIRQHHETFITASDLEWLVEHEVEILRVPVGYWIFGDDNRYVGGLDRLDWLMTQAESLGLLVLIDLHAAPEAQNRAVHSGSGNTISDKHSTKWLNNSKAQHNTIETLCRLAERYRDSPALWGLQLLNEPAVDFFGIALARFYRRAYRRVIQVARPGTRIVFSDGYAPLRLTNCLWLMTKRDFPAVMDVHIYQVFGRRFAHGSVKKYQRSVRRSYFFLRLLRLQQPLIVGEWSAMLPVRTSESETTQYYRAQRHAFRPALAQFYWSYKTESDGRWNYRDQSEKELLQ